MFLSVFGGSQSKQGDQSYTDGLILGRELALNGHTILTGGYIGLMEAVSRGANEAGGNVIGVTCDQIEKWRPVKPNKWITEEWRRSTLIERLEALIINCDAAIALPGGPGTLTEIALTWNLMIVAILPLKPIIIVGDGWKTVFDQLFINLSEYTPSNQRELLTFCQDIHSVTEIINNFQMRNK